MLRDSGTGRGRSIGMNSSSPEKKRGLRGEEKKQAAYAESKNEAVATSRDPPHCKDLDMAPSHQTAALLPPFTAMKYAACSGFATALVGGHTASPHHGFDTESVVLSSEQGALVVTSSSERSEGSFWETTASGTPCEAGL
ncbi:hypothetical protein INR49_030184 [Caranx melampygus]|nr:hypothetical protein INR49_030184 [Caranx melampygus]